MAVTLDAAGLAEALAVKQTVAERLLPVAVALVEDYAPGAPSEVQDEAALRCCGWLVEQPRAAVRSERQGDIETEFNPSSLSALRHSGAMGLLTRWKVRRGGAV